MSVLKYYNEETRQWEKVSEGKDTYSKTEVDTKLSNATATTLADAKAYTNAIVDGLTAEGDANAGAVQAALNAHIADKSNPHGTSLSTFGITSTATELNYVDGVTSNIQTQLNAKVPTSRTVNGKALSSNISLTASDVGAATPSSTIASLSASGNIITYTKGDGSTGTVTVSGSGSSGSAGMIREFATEGMSVSTYTYSGSASKFYIVTLLKSGTNKKSVILDYRAAYYGGGTTVCADNNSTIVQLTINSSTLYPTFTAGSGYTIRYVAGYY